MLDTDAKVVPFLCNSKARGEGYLAGRRGCTGADNPYKGETRLIIFFWAPHPTDLGKVMSHSATVMVRAIAGLGSLAATLLADISPCVAWDNDWTAVTLARDGSWGLGNERSQPEAIATAICNCRTVSGPQSDCGAQFTTANGGWTVASICGHHKIIATGINLAHAEQEAFNREIDLQHFYVPDLPPCRRVVTVDPAGVNIPPRQQHSNAR